MNSILRPGAVKLSSDPMIERKVAETIQNATAIPISRNTWRAECQ